MSTGSAAQRRSNASAFAASIDRTCTSGERFVIALLHELELLPFAVDRRIEVLRMLRSPDLRADEEVVGIEAEGFAPDRDRVTGCARRVAIDASRKELERARIHPFLLACIPGPLASEEAFEVPPYARVGDVEVVDVAVPDN